MARKAVEKSEAGREETTSPPASLGQVYPTIARWASGYGYVEFGIDGLDRPFVRALDEGGTVWEGEARYESLDEALQDLEKGLVRSIEGQGLVEKPRAKTAIHRPRKAASKGKGSPEKPLQRTIADPVLKKVERLEGIAAELRQGKDFSITRLTVLKSLCEEPKAAGEFALFLARRVQKRLREKDAPERYRGLVNRAVRELRPYLHEPTDDRRERLRSLWHEMREEQNEYKNIAWGAARLIKSTDLLVAEKCLESVLRPHEAPFWLYQAARDYCERYSPKYGTGLIPQSAPMVEEVAGFWRDYHGAGL
jgi:hypothetical protein